MNGTTAIELSCIHISLASWHLFVPSSVYYASGTSLAKFPDDGIIVTQTLKDQGKTTAFLPRIWFTFVFLLYMYFIPYSWIHSYRLKTLHILIFSISHSKQSNIHLLYFSWATCTMYDTMRNLPQIMFFVVLLNWLWNQFFSLQDMKCWRDRPCWMRMFLSWVSIKPWSSPAVGEWFCMETPTVWTTATCRKVKRRILSVKFTWSVKNCQSHSSCKIC